MFKLLGNSSQFGVQ